MRLFVQDNVLSVAQHNGQDIRNGQNGSQIDHHSKKYNCFNFYGKVFFGDYKCISYKIKKQQPMDIWDKSVLQFF